MESAPQEQAQQAKGLLEHWHEYLSKWIAWLDTEIADISSGKPPNKTLFILLQHVALLKPWFCGLINALPVRVPENVPVTRLAYEESSERRLSSWGQCISHRDHSKGILNRETDAS